MPAYRRSYAGTERHLPTADAMLINGGRDVAVNGEGNNFPHLSPSPSTGEDNNVRC